MQEILIPMLRCPICSGKMERRENSLVCGMRHCFDVARQGYVNFVPAQKDMFYKKELFESRAKAFEAGVFAPVVSRISQAIDEHVKKENPVVLDAGCGEGYYIKSICPQREMIRAGFDLSKDAVRLAAKGPKAASFFAADLKRIPMQDQTCDAVLDIFTPADYAEFGRVLRKEGVLIKLAPRSGYLKELRALAGDMLRRKEYDGSSVESYAHERMEILEQTAITYTVPVTQETAYHLARMTPMLAGIDVEKLDLSLISEITIDETMYVGRVKNT
ncbi:MAG: methyltransferase domain-containing protein [Clostridia bacterium]|nr:methyltransferase domain-containing protein [Clostridia bacterium]